MANKMLLFPIMTWHEHISSTLAELSSREHIPDNLIIDEQLRTAFKSVENRSTADPQTLRAAQAIAECAIPMVAELADTIDDGIITRLRRVDKWWRDRSTPNNTNVHDTLMHVSRYYLPHTSRTGPYELGHALHAAAHLVSHAYPVHSGRAGNAEVQLIPGDILHVVGFFAITSRMHLDVCGPDSNQAAVADLARSIEAASDRATSYAV